MQLEPLQFNPILKDRIWGGTKLKSLLNKNTTSAITGESWEISTVQDNVSEVAFGKFKGKSLNELINLYPNEILGTRIHKIFGKQFPLLFKYLDAQQDLSIQVHPNDEMAKKYHNSFGKTEMWYVMQANQNSNLIVGFKENSSSNECKKHLKNNTILSILDTKKVKKGDVFFLETGTIHAIGAGIVIAEIQQTSDITYRVYDFDRIDANGNKRELHIDLAAEALNYNTVKSQINYATLENATNTIVSCTYFTTNIIPLNGAITCLSNLETFKVYMCTEGNFTIEYTTFTCNYSAGDTVLIPASIPTFKLSGKATLLEIYI